MVSSTSTSVEVAPHPSIHLGASQHKLKQGNKREIKWKQKGNTRETKQGNKKGKQKGKQMNLRVVLLTVTAFCSFVAARDMAVDVAVAPAAKK